MIFIRCYYKISCFWPFKLIFCLTRCWSNNHHLGLSNRKSQTAIRISLRTGSGKNWTSLFETTFVKLFYRTLKGLLSLKKTNIYKFLSKRSIESINVTSFSNISYCINCEYACHRIHLFPIWKYTTWDLKIFKG